MWQLATRLPEKTAVAVSGGPDSMALLHFLSRVPGRVCCVVHCRYSSARASEDEAAQEDYRHRATQIVRQFAKERDLPIYEDWQIFHSEHLASEQRREIFGKIHDSLQVPVAVGHTLDDALEWFLIRTFARPTGRAEDLLTAESLQENFLMWAVNLPVYRPLLYTRRDQILRYCHEHGVPFADDPSNVGEANLRARIRKLRVVSSIETCFPESVKIFTKKLRQTNEGRAVVGLSGTSEIPRIAFRAGGSHGRD